jgi:hypothetical protein
MENVIVKVPFRGREVELEIARGVNLFYGSNEVGKSTLIKEIARKLKEAGIVRTIAHMSGDEVAIGDMKFNINDTRAWKELTAEPPFYLFNNNIEADFKLFLGIKYLHGGYALRVTYEPQYETRWVPIAQLSYGVRKGLALLIASMMADLIAVEVFDGGLHFDLAADILETIHNYEKYALIETHAGILIPIAWTKGWNVFYVSDDGIARLTKENVFELGMVQKELELLTNIRGGL